MAGKTLEYQILVVDDEEFIRKLTVRLLSTLGTFTVLEAVNGKDALQKIDEQGSSIDLVLCDLMMPDMDGIEFVRHLSERNRPPPIAFLSGAETSVLRAADSLARARRLSVLGALPKPVKQDDLTNVLGRLAEDFAPRAVRQHPDISHDELKRAIDKDELFFHYQPKVAIKERALSSVEALVRWNHPEHGLVFPDAFIGLAESGPLITPMTEKLIEIGFRQLAAWKDEGLSTRVGVNLSPSMLSDVSLPERLTALAKEHALEPESIILEITETGMPDDEAVYMEIVTRLHMMGFAISIDDFGTGQSSLQKLDALPFNELKVDRAFVDGASKIPTKRAILEAALSLAKSLNLKTVGEGVEEKEDWDLLEALGCDVIQGYFVARPMAAEAIPKWLEDWS